MASHTKGPRLTPQEQRAYDAMKTDWADKRTLARALDKPNGQRCSTPPTVIVSKIRKKIAPFGFTVETKPIDIEGPVKRPVLYRVVKMAVAA